MNLLSLANGAAFNDAVEMVRVKLVIAYEGTRYAGWQVQRNGVGVQQEVESALGRLFPPAPRVHSSSRTDAGVHAVGMVAHVDLPKERFRMSPSKLMLALNAFLPEDIRILRVTRCRQDFHARFSATGKQYRYFVWNHPAMNPLLRRQAWHVPQKLDREAMKEAARWFLGKHDFKSFANRREYEMETTVRTLHRCEVRCRGPLITFVVEGDGFLYKMCRGIVGTLVQVGRGKYGAEDVRAMLAARDRRAAGMTAPAHGLVLWKVFYKGQPHHPKQRMEELPEPPQEIEG